MFKSNEERNEYGGTAFIEIQYCKLKPTTKLKKIVSGRIRKYWVDDSLYIYIDDISKFLKLYADILGMGVYSNLKTGFIDITGVNYYKKEDVELIINKLKEAKPNDYEVLLNWLEESKNYNGFYILGI